LKSELPPAAAIDRSQPPIAIPNLPDPLWHKLGKTIYSKAY
jgi:hypothetical protein